MSGDQEHRDGGSITHFFQQVRLGEPLAAEILWDRYFPRLLGLARKTLRHRCRTATGPEDIVQSAFVSFWKRARVGDFSDWITRNDVWNLLAKITVRKVHQTVRRAHAKKRGAGDIVNEADLRKQSDRPFALDEAVATLPTAELDLCCEEYLAALDEETRSVVLLKMMGHKNLEVADLLGYTETKVERKLRIARKTWKLDDDLNPEETVRKRRKNPDGPSP